MHLVISPDYSGPDHADGGIRRVVEAQQRYLPELGFELLGLNEVERADVVAVHAGSSVRIPPRTPVVAHCHGLYWAEYKWHNWHELLNKQVIDVLHRAEAVTAPSHWVGQALRRNFYIEPTVLWHGVDLDEWPLPAEHDDYILWNKARVDAVCDPEPVAKLASLFRTESFVTTYAHAGFGKNVEVVPPVDYEAARELVRKAAVYLCTTRETFGIGTLEAMASGVPILGWNYGGQAEFIRHGETGWLANVDDYDSLAEGLVYCLKNRERLGQAARKDVEQRFQWRDVMKQYASLYERTLAARLEQDHNPRTTVIVTNYNLSMYLPECVDSLLAQSDPDFEVVLIDDASTEAGEAEAVSSQASRDPRIRPIFHEENRYLAESLNHGLELAKGRYILPLDADNEIAPDTLRILADRLDADRSVDIAYGSVEFHGGPEDRRFISEWPPSEFSFRAQLTHRNQIPSTALYRKEAATKVGGYRPRCKTAEDADFWCRATSFGARPVKATDAVTLIYRDRSDSMSRVNKDWPWEAWYTWGRKWELTPAAALVEDKPSVLHAADPLISVVIPVGPGHERKVLDALDSIQAQTFTNWECIIVDAAGGTVGWLPPWAARIGGEQMGPATARNLGMSITRGKYFIFLDADDYLEPDALEKMLTTVLRGDPADFVYTDWIIDEERRIVASKEHDCDGLLKQLEYPVTALYPMEAWGPSGGFDPAFEVAWEDWDFALRIARAGFCGLRLSEPLLHYRMSAGLRREEGFARREELKQLVYDKWKPYIEGTEKMPCGACGQKRAAATPARVVGGAPQNNIGDAILLEYTGQNAGPMTYVGLTTGTKYRFGMDADHRTRYVHVADAEHLLSMADDFKRAGDPKTAPELVSA